MGILSGLWTGLVWFGAIGAALLTLHSFYNLSKLRRPTPTPANITERVSILIPARNEAHNIGACIESLLKQTNLSDGEIIVLDDQSDDGTTDVIREIAGSERAVRVITGTDRPEGWLGKTWACHQLQEAANGSVLVFIDADVVLEPVAIASTVQTLREAKLDLVCPYPKQLAETTSERLIQPLLQWSWATTLPLGIAENSSRESLSAANGQFLAVDAKAYQRAGGHEAVKAAVLDDVELLRAIKRSGAYGTVIDGTTIATCRMYDNWSELSAGYTKSLWTAFGSLGGSIGAMVFLAILYLVPTIAMFTGSVVGLVGWLAAIAGRAVIARRMQSPLFPDAILHPFSIAILIWLTIRSWIGHRRGTLQWKGRTLT